MTVSSTNDNIKTNVRSCTANWTAINMYADLLITKRSRAFVLTQYCHVAKSQCTVRKALERRNASVFFCPTFFFPPAVTVSGGR